jgi:hypothetical protein
MPIIPKMFSIISILISLSENGLEILNSLRLGDQDSARDRFRPAYIHKTALDMVLERIRM